MRIRPRFLMAGLLILAGLVIGVTGAFAQDDGAAAEPAAAQATAEGPRSPQELFRLFFRTVKNEQWSQGFTHFKLTEQQRQEFTPKRLVSLLNEVLNFHGFIDVDSLPDADAIGERESWSLRTVEGPIETAPTDGVWMFTPDTVARLDAMREGYVASGRSAYRPFSLRDQVPASLRNRALFLEHWQWLGIAGLFLLAWIAHRIVGFFVHLLLASALRRRGWGENASDAADNAGRPLGFFAVAAIIVVGTPFLQLPFEPVNFDRLSIVTGKFFASLGAVLVCYRLADVIAARMAAGAAQTASKLDDQLVPLVRKSVKILVTVGGALFILDNLEVNIVSLLTGAGVIGIGVAFAAKDTIANLFGSITVFLDRPFQVGDWINIGGMDGTVEEVGFRSTRIRTFYNSVLSIPNAKLVDSMLDNYGARRYRRYKTVLGVRYDTPAERIEAFCEGIRNVVRANPHMRQDYYHVYLNDFGASSLNILVYVFFDVPDWGDELRERQNFIAEVIRLAEHLGVGFAFPTQTLHLESSPERPLPPVEDKPVDELDAVQQRFGPQGDLARPHGTARFSTKPQPHAGQPRELRQGGGSGDAG